MVKDAVERKEVLGVNDKVAKERCIYQNKREVNEQFKRKVNQDVDGNRKLFWKEVSKVNREKVESCS